MKRWKQWTTRLKEQVQRNLVALISLIVAVTGLSYNTWRNEQSEANRNQRDASFVLLIKLGEMQELVFHTHYDDEADRSARLRSGWALVLTTRDLAVVVSEPVADSAQSLFDDWEAHSAKLGEDQDTFILIRDSIQDVRDETLALLEELE